MSALKKRLQSEWVSRFFDSLLPVFATLAALLIGAVMLLFLRVNPIEAYAALWDGAFGSPNAFAETLVKATPLLLVALGICISFRGDVINIGGEGQMIVGAIFATWVGAYLYGPARLAGDRPCPAGGLLSAGRSGADTGRSRLTSTSTRSSAR
jgi:ABC-type uncharacterized transport system permease subunit